MGGKRGFWYPRDDAKQPAVLSLGPATHPFGYAAGIPGRHAGIATHAVSVGRCGKGFRAEVWTKARMWHLLCYPDAATNYVCSVLRLHPVTCNLGYRAGSNWLIPFVCPR